MTLSAEENELLTRVGPNTAMGRLLKRYWHPVAAVTELDESPTKPLRLFGEDLVLYRDRRGRYGLIDRKCPHRGMDLSYGMVEECGLRCPYHGWAFDETGACIDQPFETAVRPASCAAQKVKIASYPVEAKAGLVWAYLGDAPPPCLPDWGRFGDRGFKQIIMAELPCNWLQCQENAVDPVHFEWLHFNWTLYQQGKRERTPRHLKIAFDEFDHGFVYRRLLEGSSETDEAWTVGRVCLWPNCLYTGSFAWYVPIDDENTMLVMWTLLPLPGTRPVEQPTIPHWYLQLQDPLTKRWNRAAFTNQDCLAWVSQGRIADRTKERLGESDRGVILLRKRFFRDLERVAAGEDPSGLVRDASKNERLPLPLMSDQIVAPPRPFPPMSQGQPQWLADEYRRLWSEHSGGDVSVS